MRATDPEYALAMKNADTAKVCQLENLYELQAEEITIQMNIAHKMSTHGRRD